MATKTFEELKQLAIQIRDEKTNKQNTATRVGTAMLEHINKLEQDYYDKTQTDEELKERDDKLTELLSNVININYTNKEDNNGIYHLNGKYSELTGYNVYTYDILPNTILSIHIKQLGALSNNWAVAALYDGDAFIETILRGDGTTKIFDAIAYTKNATKLKIMCQPYSMDNKYVFINSLGINAYNFIDEQLGDSLYKTVAQKTISANINELKRFNVNYKLLSDYSLITDKGAITIQGDIVFNDDWGGNVYEVEINTPCILNLSIDSTYTYTNWYSYASIYEEEKLLHTLIQANSKNSVRNIVAYIPSGNKLKFMSKNLEIVIIQLPLVFTESNLPSVNDIISLPDKIYQIDHTDELLNFENRLYIEGIAKTDAKNLKINNSNSIPIEKSTDDKISITVSCDGYSSLYKEIPIISTSAEKAQNKKIRPLLIGDSLTDNGYPSLCEFIFKNYNSKLGNINPIFVGTIADNIDITIQNQKFTCRGCNEGRSGWLISNYLRHICQTHAGRFGWSSDSNALTGKVAWDSLGLATKTRNGISERQSKQDYTEWTPEVGEQIRMTCHGYYDADPSEDLWNWLVKTKGIKTFEYEEMRYTFSEVYSTSDDEIQKKAIKYLCENPENPFFNIIKVNNTNNEYAFDFAIYINRYKTIEDDGTNRLVVGSTAGSKVSNVNDFDVCTPTHVVVFMNQNEVFITIEQPKLIRNIRV